MKDWTAALIDTYRLPPMHAPGQVLVDLAVTIADGGDALRHLRTLRDQAKLFGLVASDPTAWRWWTRSTRPGSTYSATHGRRRGNGPGRPALARTCPNSCGCTSIPPCSPRTRTRKTLPRRGRRIGFHPLLCYLDRPRCRVVRRWPDCCGQGTREVIPPPIMWVLDMAIAALPPRRHGPGPDAA